MKKVKIREYAKEHSVTYRTVWNWVKKGLVKYEQLPSGTILIIVE
jgi:predicted site-specific integrase-resolvase